jgi:hypothetical protein
MDVEQRAIFVRVAPGRPGARRASGFGVLRDFCGVGDQLCAFFRTEPAGLEPTELDRERIGVDPDRSPPQETRFHQHGAAAAERIEHGRVELAQRLHQPRRGIRVQPGRIAVKTVHVSERGRFARIDRERVRERTAQRLSGADDLNVASDVTQSAPRPRLHKP